ncbi:2Fe-2S iron-sulfur cluster-binding protein [Curvibacter gracilis]|uniref:2Fe-2S iron-sulfur cluster-binding protein n=1 Tax=Curvibacter gracilis TaxID=230310 RepID=UPI0004882015|nr:2Fe-2S iron-sulfur cluster-binding protein [Curvibacter gracilis]
MSEWRIRCPDLEVEWLAAEGESLLESAERAGIELLSSCRNGTCRTCMCRLVAGEVRYRIEWPGLSREEKAEGWVLPCVAEPTGPRELSLDSPWAGLK